ncbi:transcription antitermination factor NusB [Bdellovibrionota bacterium FG-1]
MKPSRHQARETALQILYRYDSGSTVKTLLTPTTILEEINKHFDHFRVADELRGFTAELVAGTLRELPTLDALLEKHAANWKISRMSSIDRNLLRMATFELQNFPDTPPSVVIDEAIELAKQFGSADSPSFVNGILDAIKNGLKAAV